MGLPSSGAAATKKTTAKHSKAGVFSVGRHEIHHSDCLTALDKLPSGSVDVVVTSPPYNINLAYNTYKDTRTEDNYLKWMEAVAVQIKRVMKEDGSFFLNISGASSKPWLPFELASRLRDHFELQNHITWVKSIAVDRVSSGHFKPISGGRFIHHNHEHIFHLTKTGSVSLDRLAIGVPFTDKSNIGRFGHAADLRCRGNTWFIPYKTVKSKTEKFSHPGTFPVQLPLWCIQLHGRADAVVLDPFLGTGTTIIAASQAGARGIGIEIDPTYVETAVERIMAEMESSMRVTVNQTEMVEILKQDPLTKKDGGFQGLMISLQEALNKTTGELTLTADHLRRIPIYAFDYDNGGWEDRLKTAFARHLGPNLGRVS